MENTHVDTGKTTQFQIPSTQCVCLELAIFCVFVESSYDKCSLTPRGFSSAFCEREPVVLFTVNYAKGWEVQVR